MRGRSAGPSRRVQLATLRGAGRCCWRVTLAIATLAPVAHARAQAANAPSGGDASDPAPVVLQRGRFNVMLATPSSLEWARAHDGTARAIARCASALHVDTTSARAAAASDPWTSADSTGADRSELVIQVVGQPLSAAACGLESAVDPGMIARGVALVAGRYPDPSGSVASITLRRGDSTIIPPLRTAQSAPTYVGAGSAAAGAADPVMARGYFGAGTITPRRDGTFAPLLLVVVSERGDTTNVPIPGALLERLWPGVVAARLPDSAAAALRSAKRLAGSRLTVRDALAARLMIASELLAEHDTAAAAATVAPALRSVPALPAAPCLQLASSAPTGLRKLVDDLRPKSAERCAELGVARTMLRGLLVPGGSQVASGQRTSGYIVAGFVVAAGAGALALHQRANQQYRAYRAVTYPIKVPDAYRRANNTRHAVVTVLTGGAAVWVAAAIEGGVAAAFHDRDLRRVQNYGASPVARVGGDGVGLGLAVSFGRGHS